MNKNVRGGEGEKKTTLFSQSQNFPQDNGPFSLPKIPVRKEDFAY